MGFERKIIANKRSDEWTPNNETTVYLTKEDREKTNHEREKEMEAPTSLNSSPSITLMPYLGMMISFEN